MKSISQNADELAQSEMLAVPTWRLLDQSGVTNSERDQRTRLYRGRRGSE